MRILRKYGEAATINFALFEADGVNFRTDAVYAAGDIQISKDEGAEANTTNGFTDEGTGYSLALTATEMEAARIVLYIVDQTATKVWLDREIVIETYGNASAQHALDLDTALEDQTIGTCTTNTDMRGTDGANTDKTDFALSTAGNDAIITALNAELYDGKTFEEIQELLVALSLGNIAVSGVGTGTVTIILYAQDGTTPLATFEQPETGSTAGSRTLQ